MHYPSFHQNSKTDYFKVFLNVFLDIVLGDITLGSSKVIDWSRHTVQFRAAVQQSASYTIVALTFNLRTYLMIEAG